MQTAVWRGERLSRLTGVVGMISLVNTGYCDLTLITAPAYASLLTDDHRTIKRYEFCRVSVQSKRREKASCP